MDFLLDDSHHGFDFPRKWQGAGRFVWVLVSGSVG